MKQKDNRSTGAVVVSLTFAVVVFTALYIQHQSAIESVAVVDTPAFLEDVNFSEMDKVEETVTSETDVLEDEIATPEPPGVISFAKAYAIAREALGPGQTFTWDGMLYSTNTVEEAAAQTGGAPPEINLADAQDSLDNTLSHAITPEF